MNAEQLYAVKLFEFEREQARRKRRPNLPCLLPKQRAEYVQRALDKGVEDLRRERMDWIKDLKPGRITDSSKMSELTGKSRQSCANILQYLYQDGILDRRQKTHVRNRPTWEYFLTGTI